MNQQEIRRHNFTICDPQVARVSIQEDLKSFAGYILRALHKSFRFVFSCKFRITQREEWAISDKRHEI